MNDYGRFSEEAIARNITESYSLTPGDRATALRQMVYNSCAEVRRLMDENAKLRDDLAEQWREKEGKP